MYDENANPLLLSWPSACDLQACPGSSELPLKENKVKQKWAIKSGLSSLICYISRWQTKWLISPSRDFPCSRKRGGVLQGQEWANNRPSPPEQEIKGFHVPFSNVRWIQEPSFLIWHLENKGRLLKERWQIRSKDSCPSSLCGISAEKRIILILCWSVMIQLNSSLARWLQLFIIICPLRYRHR